ncbi:hypothetical protein PRIPAC_92717 [Pristionchus pacificus]|nr:hypothetical protein PRIPAC_92717 [Pristionchus pacificus]
MLSLQMGIYTDSRPTDCSEEALHMDTPVDVVQLQPECFERDLESREALNEVNETMQGGNQYQLARGHVELPVNIRENHNQFSQQGTLFTDVNKRREGGAPKDHPLNLPKGSLAEVARAKFRNTIEVSGIATPKDNGKKTGKTKKDKSKKKINEADRSFEERQRALDEEMDRIRKSYNTQSAQIKEEGEQFFFTAEDDSSIEIIPTPFEENSSERDIIEVLDMFELVSLVSAVLTEAEEKSRRADAVLEETLRIDNVERERISEEIRSQARAQTATMMRLIVQSFMSDQAEAEFTTRLAILRSVHEPIRLRFTTLDEFIRDHISSRGTDMDVPFGNAMDELKSLKKALVNEITTMKDEVAEMRALKGEHPEANFLDDIEKSAQSVADAANALLLKIAEVEYQLISDKQTDITLLNVCTHCFNELESAVATIPTVMELRSRYQQK